MWGLILFPLLFLPSDCYSFALSPSCSSFHQKPCRFLRLSLIILEGLLRLMDIDPSLSYGGWTYCLEAYICMAVHLVGLILLLLLARPSDNLCSTMASTSPVTRPGGSGSVSTTARQDSSSFHSMAVNHSHHSSSLSPTQYNATAHEVPSGANPISNR